MAELEHLSWLAYQPQRYQHLLDAKVAAVARLFAGPLGQLQVEVFASAPSHFRQRVRFALARFESDGSLSIPGSTTGRLCYALHNRGRCIPRPDTFPIAAEAVCALMPQLLNALENDKMMSAGIECAHFLSTCLLYTSPSPRD